MLEKKYEQWRQYYSQHQLAFAPETDAFDGYLTFGTGGIRGLMGVGTNRLNVPIIRRVTMGLVAYLKDLSDTPTVAVCYDTRKHSREFAEAAVALLAYHNIPSFLAAEPSPTPELSFATRYYHATAGIMITASHNPAAYNGYKLYDENGCQLVPKQAALVAQAISTVGSELSIQTQPFTTALASGRVTAWTPALGAAYLVAVQKRVVTDTSDFKTLLSYNKYIRNVGFRTFPMHL